MDGGPSHIDTFDPKPGSPHGGTFRAIGTRSGFQLSEHLPRLAQNSGKIAVVRNMTSPELDHGRGSYYLRNGYRPQESVDYPAMGSIFARELAAEDSAIPPFVAVTPFVDPLFGGGPGCLGDSFAPFVVENPGDVPGILSVPEGVAPERHARRLRFHAEFERGLEARLEAEARDARDLREKAIRYMDGPLAGVLDLSGEDPALRARYGEDEGEYTRFGQSCLLARRLVESGVRFVEITMENGWDTHEDNFVTTRDNCRHFDPGLAALLEDLDRRGLLDSTLVLCGGEFGRTPAINETGGRDHHGDAFSFLLAGGGVRGGQAVGEPDADGAQPVGTAYQFPDLFATAAVLAGIDPDEQYLTPEGRPIRIAEYSRFVKEVL